MRIGDLEIGMTVTVIDYGGDPYNRPEHWAETGEMDEWQGAVVTIADIDPSDEYVYLEEDENEWSWYPWDFEPYCNLKYHDPNISYKRHKSNIMMRHLRAELAARKAKKGSA